MFLIDKIIPSYFIIALGVGILFVYITQKSPKIIYKYPTPEKTKNEIYQDDSNQCYKYKTSKVNCPLDKSKILDITG